MSLKGFWASKAQLHVDKQSRKHSPDRVKRWQRNAIKSIMAFDSLPEGKGKAAEDRHLSVLLGISESHFMGALPNNRLCPIADIEMGEATHPGGQTLRLWFCVPVLGIYGAPEIKTSATGTRSVGGNVNVTTMRLCTANTNKAHTCFLQRVFSPFKRGKWWLSKIYTRKGPLNRPSQRTILWRNARMGKGKCARKRRAIGAPCVLQFVGPGYHICHGFVPQLMSWANPGKWRIMIVWDAQSFGLCRHWGKP